MLMATTARGLLMLNPRLILPSSMVPTIILMPTLVSTTDMPDTTLDTHMLIMPTPTARGPLMLSQRPRLRLTTATTPTPTEATEPTDTEPTHMLIMPTPTARGPLMLSQRPRLRLMLTTATTATVTGPTTLDTTLDTPTPTLATEATTGDKFSPPKVQSRSSKRTSLLVI